VIAAAPMRESRRGGGLGCWWGRAPSAITRVCSVSLQDPFPSCLQNSSQAMTVTHVLATMIEAAFLAHVAFPPGRPVFLPLLQNISDIFFTISRPVLPL